MCRASGSIFLTTSLGQTVSARCVAASILAVGCAFWTEAQAQFTPNVDPVTSDDCQIIAQILSSKTTNPLSFASFGAACDWSKLKFAVRTTNATTDWRVYFRHPEYDTDGTHASVSYADTYNEDNGMYGSHEFKCNLDKRSGQWRIIDCQMGVIAN